MKDALNAWTVSPQDLSALEVESRLAGDVSQVTLCQIALAKAPHTLADISTILGHRYPGPWIRGWHLDGPGPARFGWGRHRAAGGREFIGPTLSQIARAECARVINEARAQEDRS